MFCRHTGRYFNIMPKVRQKRSARTVGTSRSLSKSSTGCGKNDDLADKIVATVVLEYKKHGCSSSGADMTRYMRGKFEFFGLGAVERRAIDRKVCVRFRYASGVGN